MTDMRFALSATRLKLKGWRVLPIFLYRNQKIIEQLCNSEGFVHGALLPDRNLTFWTVTVWQDIEAMKIFKNSDAHLKIMPKLKAWCNEAATASWYEESSQIPDWLKIHELISKSKPLPGLFSGPVNKEHPYPLPNTKSRFYRYLTSRVRVRTH